MRRLHAFIVMLAFALSSSASDTVILRDGARHANVKIMPRGDYHVINFESGRTMRVKNYDIKLIRIADVKWNAPRKRKPKPARPVSKLVFVAKIRSGNLDPRTPPKPIKPRSNATRPNGTGPSATKSNATKSNATGPNATGTGDSVALGPLARSMILPGWGQYHTGESVRGALFFSASALLFSRYWDSRQALARAEERYNNPLTPAMVMYASPNAGGIAFNLLYLNDLKRQSLDLAKQGNNNLVLFWACWTWNVIDIARTTIPAIGKTLSSRRPDASGLNVTISYGPNAVGLALEARF